MGDGSRLGKLPVGQQHTDAVGFGFQGVVGDLIQLGLRSLMPEKCRGEARNGRRDTQVAKQWRIMHPVETGLAVAVVKGMLVRRKHDEIAFFPEDGVPAGIGSALAAIDKEQLASGLDGSLNRTVGYADKFCAKAGLVAGEGQPSSSLKSSGWRRVGPESKNSGEKARQGTGLKMIFW